MKYRVTGYILYMIAMMYLFAYGVTHWDTNWWSGPTLLLTVLSSIAAFVIMLFDIQFGE